VGELGNANENGIGKAGEEDDEERAEMCLSFFFPIIFFLLFSVIFLLFSLLSSWMGLLSVLPATTGWTSATIGVRRHGAINCSID
jgi:Cu/Ag efflux pump CusA